MQELVEQTYAGELVSGYAVSLVQATRSHPLLQRGASPRATLALISLCRAIAQLRGRDYVLPEDVQETFPRCLAHRVQLSAAAQSKNMQAEDVLQQILTSVAPPKLR